MRTKHNTQRHILANVSKLLSGILYLLIMVMAPPLAQANETLRVAFINPDNEDSQFWSQLSDYMKVASSQYEIDLTIRHANFDRYRSVQIARELVSGNNKPDYLIMMYQVGVGQKILELMEANQIPVFIINTDIHPHDKPSVGLPREAFKYWIGHMSPNDFAAGQMLTDHLIDQTPGEANIVALSGGRDSSAALDRNQGLYFATQEMERAHLVQLVFSEWNALNAGKQTIRLLNRHPKTNIIWTAGDTMAVAAAHKARELSPKDRILTGGIDWSKNGLKAVKDGWISATAGGHFLEGALALIMLFDYHHGIDFASEGTRFYTEMHLAHDQNIDRYYDALFYDQLKNFDFTTLSKFLNPEKKHYELNIHTILDTFMSSRSKKK